MKYSEVPGGAIFYFEGNPNYPKRKVGLGHIDIRDNVSGSGAGLQNHEVYLQEAAQQPRATDGATGWACDCGFVSSVDYKNCRWCGKPRR